MIGAGRAALCARVQAGKLTLHQAQIVAGIKHDAPKWRALRIAWNCASAGERQCFLAWLAIGGGES